MVPSYHIPDSGSPFDSGSPLCSYPWVAVYYSGVLLEVLSSTVVIEDLLKAQSDIAVGEVLLEVLSSVVVDEIPLEVLSTAVVDEVL